jgi:hypothetical protein
LPQFGLPRLLAILSFVLPFQIERVLPYQLSLGFLAAALGFSQERKIQGTWCCPACSGYVGETPYYKVTLPSMQLHGEAFLGRFKTNFLRFCRPAGHCPLVPCKPYTPGYFREIARSCEVAVQTRTCFSSKTTASQNRTFLPALRHRPSARKRPCVTGFK